MDNDWHDGVAELTLTYSAEDVEIRSTPFGAVITLEGAEGIGEPGDPAIPRAIARVALPPGAVVTSVRAEAVQSRTLLPQPVFLAPVQEVRAGRFVPDSEIKPSLRRFTRPLASEALPPPKVALPDPGQYERMLAQPRPLALILDPGGELDSMAIIEVNPLAVDERGILVLHERIQLWASYEIRPVTAQTSFTSEAQLRDRLLTQRSLVVNPQDIMLKPHVPIDWLLARAEYLVITDRCLWNAQEITPGDTLPDDPVAEFERLAEWKRQRGLTARVVTITEIVTGEYGDFRSGARDLPEVIRNFVKHARAKWGTRWLLLGGDIDIVPARIAFGGLLGTITPGTKNPPDPAMSFWNGSSLYMNTAGSGDWWGASADNTLLRRDNGRVIPYRTAGLLGPGSSFPLPATPHWHFATDGTYSVLTDMPTDFVVVHGTAAQVSTAMRFLYRWNRIPTDFYYASLTGSGYGVAGKHDWDVHSNGVYGEYAAADSDDMDRITWRAHVSVGRAPILTGSEAKIFVNKVLAYEQMPEASPVTTGYVYERNMVIAGDNWFGRVGVGPAAASALGDNQFRHVTGTDRTIIHIPASQIPITYALYSQISETDIRFLPYDWTVQSGGRGWYYCVSETDTSPSYGTMDFFGQQYKVPVPSGYLVVYSNVPAELNPALFVLNEPVPDSSMTDQEHILAIAAGSLHGITSFDRLYTDEVDLPAGHGAAHLTQARMRDELNEGPHLVSLSGHGNPGGVCLLDARTARDLTNGLPGFIAYADSCLTGSFAESSWWVMNRELLTNPNGGAVGYVGSTRFSWIGYGDDFQRRFWQLLGSTKNLGLLADSRCDLVHAAGLHPLYTKWTVLALNLLGDPEMLVWTRPPRRLQIPEFKPKIPKWEWQIHDEFGRPVPHAVVTVVFDEQFIQVRADEHGIARFENMTVANRREVHARITITAQDHAPAMGTVVLDLS